MGQQQPQNRMKGTLKCTDQVTWVPEEREGVEPSAGAGRKLLQSPGPRQSWRKCCHCHYFFMTLLIQGR